MSHTHDVAVIGLGAMGSATSLQLARRGLDVVGIDRHGPPHVHGSTHGESRITRIGVGEGDAYVPLARRSLGIWRELGEATGRTLFVAVGALVVGRRGGFVDDTIAVAARHGVEHERLDAAGIGRRFPQHRGIARDEIAYYEPGAGFLRPEACVEVALEQAVAHGATLRTGVETRAIAEGGGGVRIETDAGTVHARHAVVTAGAGAAALLGAPFDGLLTVTRQTLYWFRPEDAGLFAPEACPVFIRCHGDGDDCFYGFPEVVPGNGVKLATEADIVVDPAAYTQGEDAADAEAFVRTHVDGRIAGLHRDPIRVATCLYTMTRDGRFIVAAHPRMRRVTVVSACSGHGFKHSAAIGELVAERLDSRIRLAPFAL